MNPHTIDHGATTVAAGMGIMLVMITIGFALFVTWIISLVDVIKNDFIEKNNKYMWLVLLLMIPPIAGVLYQAIGKKQKR